MTGMPRLSTCTMQLKNGDFCDAPADLRFPNRVCAIHAIKVYLSVKEFLDANPDLVDAIIQADQINHEEQP